MARTISFMGVSGCWSRPRKRSRARAPLLVAFAVTLCTPSFAASIQLSVFDKPFPESGGSFVLVRSGARSPLNAERPAQGEVQLVRSAMLDVFERKRAGGFLPHERVRSFEEARGTPSFVRVPQWMRTGVSNPRNFSAFAPMIRACGQKAYLPSTLLSATAEGRRKILFPLVQQAACEAGLPVSLMDAMLIQESGYNPAAVSVKGAFGLGQLMPGTARYLGVDRYDIRGNLNGAARYLREHLTEFGDASLALAAYNAGPGRVRKSRGVPNISETKDYVRSILRNWFVLENNERSMSWQKQ